MSSVPPVSSQPAPRPNTTSEVPPPAGATRINGNQQSQGEQRTGGSGDTFAPSQARAPQYQEGQGLGETTGDVPVRVSREAGDYYCEHAFFITNEFANQPDTSILRDNNGHPLSTFLHYPGGLDRPGAADRQAGAQEVVGAALRGYVDQARGQVPANEPVKVLLTGYGTFGGARDNPTQNFVTNAENVDAAMVNGFGNSLVRNADGTPQRETVMQEGQPVHRYTIQEQDGRTRNVEVMAALLPVDDTAINGGQGSLQQLETSFRPNAVINQGVRPGSRDFDFETRADDGGMRRTGNMQFTDGDQARVGGWEYENASGANAYVAGQQAIQNDRAAASSVSVAQVTPQRTISP